MTYSEAIWRWAELVVERLTPLDLLGGTLALTGAALELPEDDEDDSDWVFVVTGILTLPDGTRATFKSKGGYTLGTIGPAAVKMMVIDRMSRFEAAQRLKPRAGWALGEPPAEGLVACAHLVSGADGWDLGWYAPRAAFEGDDNRHVIEWPFEDDAVARMEDFEAAGFRDIEAVGEEYLRTQTASGSTP